MLTRFRPVLTLVFLFVLTIGSVAVVHAAPEVCGNCVDDDGDLAIDRKDSDCTARADGNDLGIGDASAGKLLTVCAKTTQKAGAKFVLGAMKQFYKCMEAASLCIQTKPGDQVCKDKAGAICNKALSGFDAAALKLQNAVIAKCGDDDASALTDLLAATGLGFASEQAPCLNVDGGPGTFTSVADIGQCIALQHICRVQHLVAIANPRAREFLTFAGRPTDEFQCIDQIGGINGAETGVPAGHVKKLLKCTKTIDKLSLSLIGSGAKVVQTCLNAGIACEQMKSGDQACLTKARAKCGAGFTKLRDPQKGTVAKLSAKFLKACGVQENLDVSDIGGPNGLGLGAQITRCTALNSAADPVGCFGKQAFCEGAQIVERQIPRARELADFLNVNLSGLLD